MSKNLVGAKKDGKADKSNKEEGSQKLVMKRPNEKKWKYQDPTQEEAYIKPDGKMAFQYLRDYIVLIPGENPGQFSLCGTNVFVVGSKDTNERIMIDAGDVSKKNKTYLKNLEAYLEHMKE